MTSLGLEWTALDLIYHPDHLKFDLLLPNTVVRYRATKTNSFPLQVLVKPLLKGARGVILKSIYGYEIEDVRIMGGESYLVARTPETLLLGDLGRNLLSEIPWPATTGGHER